MINLEEDPDMLQHSMINDVDDLHANIKNMPVNQSNINILKNEVIINGQKFKLTATS